MIRGSYIKSFLALAVFTLPLFPQAIGTINTVAGNGSSGYSGDGGLATLASMGGIGQAFGVAADNAGNFYICDAASRRVRKVNTAGIISTYAGGGSNVPANGLSATSLQLTLNAIALDNAGNLYISGSSVIYKVTPAGILSLYAGNALSFGFSGDGGPATSAGIGASNMVLDAAGNMYIADILNSRIRKVDTSGIITTVAGGGTANITNGVPATSVALLFPQGVSVDSAGNLYFADHAAYIRKVDTSGNISTFAGNGSAIDLGENVPSTSVGMTPVWTTIDTTGNLYFADAGINIVRKVNPAGSITTVAGGLANFSLGDGGPATSAQLQDPTGVSVDSAGNIYIADADHFRIRKVTESTATQGSLPTISAKGVVNGASFLPGVVSNSWATIQGFNLAPVTGDWTNAIVGGKFPSLLDTVSVTIGFSDCYIYFVSPTQINLLVPPGLPTGPVQVTVTNSAGTSATTMVNVSTYQPAFFLWPNNQAVATHQDFSLAAANGTFVGTTTVPAKPGDVIILWGTGFGPTIPAVPSGIAVPTGTTYSTSTLPTVTINSVAAMVYGAAFAPGYAGLYQVAIQVPGSLGNGNWPLVTTIGGVQSPSGVVLTVEQ